MYTGYLTFSLWRLATSKTSLKYVRCLHISMSELQDLKKLQNSQIMNIFLEIIKALNIKFKLTTNYISGIRRVSGFYWRYLCTVTVSQNTYAPMSNPIRLQQESEKAISCYDFTLRVRRRFFRIREDFLEQTRREQHHFLMIRKGRPYILTFTEEIVKVRHDW